MRYYNIIFTVMLLSFALGGCHGSQRSVVANQATADDGVKSTGAAETEPASRPVSVDPGYSTMQDVSGLSETAPVKLTAIRDAILVGRAIKCWPQTRDTRVMPAQTDPLARVENMLDHSIGKRRPAIACDASPPGNLPTDPKPMGHDLSQEPLSQFTDGLPVFNFLSRAYEQGEIPFDRPPLTMQRRWKTTVRIKPPNDVVMAEALRTVIASEPFRRSLHGLSVTLTDERPNALIVDEKSFRSCAASVVADCPPRDIRRGPRWIDGARWTRDELASRLTNGRRSWFNDGSDFSAMVPIWPIYRETGFTVGSNDAIEAAVCVVPDNVMNAQWRRDFSHAAMAKPSYRQQYAFLCLLRILGVGGVTKEMKTFPKFDDRDIDLLPVRGSPNDPQVVVGRAFFRTLHNIYSDGA